MQEAIEAKRRFSKIGWFYIADVALIYIVQLLIGLVVRALKPEWLENADITLLLSAISMYLVAFPLLMLLMKKKIPAEPVQRRKLSPGKYMLAAVICMGMAYASNFAGNIITTVIGFATGNPVENQIASVMMSVSPWAVFFYTVLCAPIMEEFVFRKLIVDRAVRYGEGIAVLTSGLMFGLFHGNLNQFIYAFVIGTMLAYLYVKTGNLKITISLHMLFNFISGFLTLLLMQKLDLGSMLEGGMVTTLPMPGPGPDTLIWWGLYGLLLLFILCILVAGLVLFIVFAAQKRFRFEPGNTAIPKELKFSIAFGNSGMLVFALYWVFMIIKQLLL